jgi:cell division protein FtsB
MTPDRAALLRRIGTIAVFAGALFFAVEGGEFGSLDLFRQRRETARLNASIDSLQRVVDSLKAYEAKVQHDPATQERIAREVFGMVRGSKEVLYRFTNTPDSAVKR